MGKGSAVCRGGKAMVRIESDVVNRLAHWTPDPTRAAVKTLRVCTANHDVVVRLTGG